MSKRNSEGEVLSNKLAVGLAKFQQQHFAALFGDSAPAVAASHDEQPVEQASIADLKGDGDEEGFGLGAIVPKDVRDGSFTNRIPTSHERLLENLIGKKAAKAHLAAQKKHAAPVKPPKPTMPTRVKEESDDEGGRASTFKSKRQKRIKPSLGKQGAGGDEDEQSVRSEKLKNAEQVMGVEENATVVNGLDDGLDERLGSVKKDTPPSRPPNAKPNSYLDEILGEKAKKKRKKKGQNTSTITNN